MTAVVGAQDDCQKLMDRAKSEYPNTVKAIEDLQKKLGRMKETPIILAKRRYYAKETIEF